MIYRLLDNVRYSYFCIGADRHQIELASRLAAEPSTVTIDALEAGRDGSRSDECVSAFRNWPESDAELVENTAVATASCPCGAAEPGLL